MRTIRVLVADDHQVVRLGICGALRLEPDVEIVGEAINGKQAVELAERLRPDVLILDVQMPEMDGVAVTHRVLQSCPQVRILVLSAFADDGYVLGTLAHGATGYLLKDEAIENVVGAVRAVARGETWLSPQVAGRLVQRVAHRPPLEGPPGVAKDQPTEREMEILNLVAEGHSNEEIGQRLHITERTVRFHLTNLFSKLNVTSRTEAVVEAIRRGLVNI